VEVSNSYFLVVQLVRPTSPGRLVTRIRLLILNTRMGRVSSPGKYFHCWYAGGFVMLQLNARFIRIMNL